MNDVMSRISSVIFLCCLVLICQRCSSPTSSNMAGGETLNERTVTVYMPAEAGGLKKAANASVSIGLAGRDQQAYTYFTNESGRFTIPELTDSFYTLFIQKIQREGTDSSIYVALQDSVFISPDSHTVQNDTLNPAGEIRGVVRLEDYHNKPQYFRNIVVHILGTTIHSHVNDSGVFTLKHVPPGEQYSLKVMPNMERYNDFYPDRISFPAQSPGNVYEMDTIQLEISGVPAIPIRHLEYDSLRGVVRLVWDPLNDFDILDYAVYRSQTNATGEDAAEKRAGKTADTVFYDTVFVALPDQNRYNIESKNLVTCNYSVVARDRGGEEGLKYTFEKDTVQLKSPRRFRTQFGCQVQDSVTRRQIDVATVNRTASFVFTAQNDLWPLEALSVSDQSGERLYYHEFTTPCSAFKDTLHFRWDKAGRRTLIVRGIDEAGEPRPFCIDTVSCEVVDFNLRAAGLILSSQPVLGKKITATLHIAKSGTVDLGTNTVDLSLYAGSTLLWRDSLTGEDLQGQAIVPVQIDTAFARPIPPGDPCSLKLVVNESETVFESNRDDNTLDTIVTVTDIDLKITRVFFDTTWLFAGRSYRCGAWVKNIGTTDHPSGPRRGRVFFSIDDKEQAWGYFDSLRAGDSIKVWGSVSNDDNGDFRPRLQAGDRQLGATIRDVQWISESNTINNSLQQQFFVDDYNISAEKLTVIFNDSLTWASCTTVIAQKGAITAAKHPNRSVNKISIRIGSEGSSLDTAVSLSQNGLTDTFAFKITEGIANLFGNGLDSIHFTLHIDADDALMETTDEDNSAGFTMPKEIFYVNGDMEDKRTDTDSLPYGWEYEEGDYATCRWNSPERGMNLTRTISIATDSRKTLSCWKYPVEVMEGKFYRVGGVVMGQYTQGADATRPAVSVSFYGTGFNVPALPKGYIDAVSFGGVMKAPPANGSYPDNITHYLSCNLGFETFHGDESSFASGEVFFDNIYLESVPDEFIIGR